MLYLVKVFWCMILILTLIGLEIVLKMSVGGCVKEILQRMMMKIEILGTCMHVCG